MKEYERQRQENERRINILRVVRSMFEAIGGHYAGTESSQVQRLAQQLHYMPEQLITDIKDLYNFVNDIPSDYWITLNRITARYNAEVDQNRRAGELDFMPDEHSSGDMLGLMIAEYALKHYPELLHDDDDE